MRYVSTFVFAFMISSCASNSISTDNAIVNRFDRKVALESYKDQCSLNFVLAMGLSAQKMKGESREELDAVAASSKDPEIMAVMVSELFGFPQLQGRTYTFFKYDNCLISKAKSQPLVNIDSIRFALLRCEFKHQGMEGLIGCIDTAIIKASSSPIKEFQSDPIKAFQEDADLLRLEHLEYWTALLDEYHKIKGHYPFHNKFNSDNDIALVKIATKQQIQYLSPGSSSYNSKLDINQTNFFKEHKVKDFVKELETVLNRTIEEKYDIQKVPTSSPVGYHYFASKDGYLVWVTCTTCGVTPVSTLLMNGFTPTVNIVSKGMVGQVPKALLKKEMLEHPIYKEWVSKSFHKEKYVRNLVKENSSDSK
jgi:hypothetical protein